MRANRLLSLAVLYACAASCAEEAQPLASLELSPRNVDCGLVPVGGSAEVLVRLTNRSATEIDLANGSIEPPSDNGRPFSFATDATSIPAQGAVEITVRCRPPEAGEHLAILQMDTSHASVRLPLRVEGRTSDLSLTPEELIFGHTVPDTSDVRSATLINNGTQTERLRFNPLANVGLCPQNEQRDENFCLQMPELDEAGAFTIEAGQTLELQFRFTARIAGLLERGSYSLTTEEDEVLLAHLQGPAVERGLRCSPFDIDFGPVEPGTCATRSFSCTNEANVVEELISVRFNLMSDPAFQSPPLIPVRLQPGETTTIEVSYCPEQLGAHQGSIEVETAHPNARLRYIQVSLEGEGRTSSLNLSTECLDFGPVSTLAPARRSVLLVNTGFEAVSVIELTADEQGTGVFRIVDPALGMVPPGSALTVTIEFSPIAQGDVESSVRILTDDPLAPELQFKVTGEGILLPSCSFETSVASLDFASVERDRAITLGVELENRGTADCLLTSAALASETDAVFSLAQEQPLNTRAERTIAPGDAKVLRVEFAPEAGGSFSGGLDLSISSADTPFVQIPLLGDGIEQDLVMNQRELKLVAQSAGCSAEQQTVRIHNPFEAPITLNSVGLLHRSSPFQLTGPISAFQVLPNNSVELQLQFDATRAGVRADAIGIEAVLLNAPYRQVLPLFAETGPNATEPRVERWVQMGTRKSDVLFVVDSSFSMQDERAELATVYSDFIQYADQNQVNYHIGITFMDLTDQSTAGQLLGEPHIIRPTTNNASAVFQQTVLLELNPAFVEQGFEAAYTALSNPKRRMENRGFLRSDASLTVILITDEPDQSPRSFPFYEDFLRNLKRGREKTKVRALRIKADGSPSCGNSLAVQSLDAFDPAGLADLTCHPSWLALFSQISPTVFGLSRRFALEGAADESSVEVLVDGVLAPQADWHYVDQAVRFDEDAIPNPGAQIEIRYVPSCF